MFRSATSTMRNEIRQICVFQFSFRQSGGGRGYPISGTRFVLAQLDLSPSVVTVFGISLFSHLDLYVLASYRLEANGSRWDRVRWWYVAHFTLVWRPSSTHLGISLMLCHTSLLVRCRAVWWGGLHDRIAWLLWDRQEKFYSSRFFYLFRALLISFAVVVYSDTYTINDLNWFVTWSFLRLVLQPLTYVNDEYEGSSSMTDIAQKNLVHGPSHIFDSIDRNPL